MNYALLIKEIGRGTKGARDMDGATAEALFGAMLDGRVSDMELGAILLSMRIKGESATELNAFVRAMKSWIALWSRKSTVSSFSGTSRGGTR